MWYMYIYGVYDDVTYFAEWGVLLGGAFVLYEGPERAYSVGGNSPLNR